MSSVRVEGLSPTEQRDQLPPPNAQLTPPTRRRDATKVLFVESGQAV